MSKSAFYAALWLMSVAMAMLLRAIEKLTR